MHSIITLIFSVKLHGRHIAVVGQMSEMDIKYCHIDLAYNTFVPECAIFLSISSIKQI